VTDVYKEFKEFISRGNVIDLAVAVVIGLAVVAIVNAIVAGLITPLIGMIGGGTSATSTSRSTTAPSSTAR
jgi:large conductance mechanosensitive channel